MINGSYEGQNQDTPGNNKRKRESFQKFVSSTPIKLSNKENFIFSDSCMEVKSVAELVEERKRQKLSNNDFEIVRKPPMKKKKAEEDFSFVNPGLDLKVNEKVINPFEVIRDDNTEAKLLAQGVINPALDIQNEVVLAEIPKNPYEVLRESKDISRNVGIENTALDLNNSGNQQSTAALLLPLPFTPTINHRIDFSNVSDNLTPSTLLSTKLVLENNAAKIRVGTPKRGSSNTTIKINKSLSIISEENGEIDIGEELDNYQLQLENSINEAKMNKRQYDFNKKNTNEADALLKIIDDTTFTKETFKTNGELTENVQNKLDTFSDMKNKDGDSEHFSSDDVQFEEVDSFEDVGKLGEFKRAYTRADSAKMNFKKPIIQENKKESKIRSSIRRIRKLIHQNTKDEEPTEKEGIFQTIRQSLRRKQKPKPLSINLETTIVGRQVFRETLNEEIPKQTLERMTLKRNVIKTVKTFIENVEEFDHY